jgi:hypothetical protein
MRIPSYNSDFEEPWYWATYGRSLYEYSFHTSRYRALHNESDADAAAAAAALVPAGVRSKFLWRRSRNFNGSMDLLQIVRDSPRGAWPTTLYVTLDDGGTYGLNVDEAATLASFANTSGLSSDRVKFYQGADEVGAVMLARLAVDDNTARQPAGRVTAPRRPLARVVWRVPNATVLTPAYESQRVARTVRLQLEAAGAAVAMAADDDPDLLFLVNNFETAPQLEASQQSPHPTSDYSTLGAVLATGSTDLNSTAIAIADVRYANGADSSLVGWMGDSVALQTLQGRYAYAGWNTDSNSVGCAAANGVLLALAAMQQGADTSSRAAMTEGGAAARFTLLRLAEDYGYQSIARPLLQQWLGASGVAWDALGSDPVLYEGIAFGPISQAANQLSAALRLTSADGNASLASVWFPWNRTFEVGLALSPAGNRTVGMRFAAGPAARTSARADDNLAEAKAVGGSTDAVGGGAKAEGGGVQAEGGVPFGMATSTTVVECDVVIVGGSTAALAAAIAAADELGVERTVCLTEPSDVLGGQLTSSLITAVDFGHANRNVSRLPSSFVALLSSLGFPHRNPGNCWVSPLCYDVRGAIAWIHAQLATRPQLRVFTLAVPIAVEATPVKGVLDENAPQGQREDPRGGPHPQGRLRSATRSIASVSSVTLVQRRPRSGVGRNGFDIPYSEQVADWYSAQNSARFTKEVVRLIGREVKGNEERPTRAEPQSASFGRAVGESGTSTLVVVDATELGDVLVMSGAPLMQGTETDEADPERTVEVCGQAIAFAAYMQQPAPASGVTPPMVPNAPQPSTPRAIQRDGRIAPRPMGRGSGRGQDLASTSTAPHATGQRSSLSRRGDAVGGAVLLHHPDGNYSLDGHSWASVWSYRRVADGWLSREYKWIRTVADVLRLAISKPGTGMSGHGKVPMVVIPLIMQARRLL